MLLSLLLYLYIYIYIYIYIWGPDSQVQGSKPGTSQMVPGDKNDFLRVPVSEPSFNGLQGSLERVQRTFSEVLGCVCEVLGLPKPWIPYSTSFKNRIFKVFASNAPLGGALEAF